MKKLNCWEFKRCGRERGGAKTHELGICPAAMETKLNGIHGGINAGRACWVVGMTMCDGVLQGSFAKKYDICVECDFFKKIKEEERSDCQPSASLYMMVYFNTHVERKLFK